MAEDHVSAAVGSIPRWVSLDWRAVGLSADPVAWAERWRSLGASGVIVPIGIIGSAMASAKAQALCQAVRADKLALGVRLDYAGDAAMGAAQPGDWQIKAKGRIAEPFGLCPTSDYYLAAGPAAVVEIAGGLRPDLIVSSGWSGPTSETICACDRCVAAYRSAGGAALPVAPDPDDERYSHWVDWSRGVRARIWEANRRATALWAGDMALERQFRARRLQDLVAAGAGVPAVIARSTTPPAPGRMRNTVAELLLLRAELAGTPVILDVPLHLPGPVAFRRISAPGAEVSLRVRAAAAAGCASSLLVGEEALGHGPSPAVVPSRQIQGPEPLGAMSAPVRVLWSQRSADRYGRKFADLLCKAPYDGMIRALSLGSIGYLPIGDDMLDDLAGAKLLVLPNVAAMSDRQVAAVTRFVRDGGALIATGETSLYDEAGRPRRDYRLAEVFGCTLGGALPDRLAAITKASPPAIIDRNAPPGFVGWLKGGATDHTYLRLVPGLAATTYGPHYPGEPREGGMRHPILAGLQNTDLIAFGGMLGPLKVEAGRVVLATYIPPFPYFPIDEVYIREVRSSAPGIVAGQFGRGRVVFLPADLDRRLGLDPIPDHAALLDNALRWALAEDRALGVTGDAVILGRSMRTANGLSIHLLNLTGADNQIAAVEQVVPARNLTVSVAIPDGMRPSAVTVASTGKPVAFATNRRNGRPWLAVSLDRLDHGDVLSVT